VYVYVFPHRETTSIFIGNLSYRIKEKELFDMMDRVGRVKRVIIGQDKRTGRSRGFAFVEFETRKDAEYAYDKYSSLQLSYSIHSTLLPL
jgi:RNA recognition motif-containing protein